MRLATSGEYCGVHAPQADLLDLYRRCVNPSWERHVEVWEATIPGTCLRIRAL